MGLNLNPLHNLKVIAGTAFSDPSKKAERNRKNELLSLLAQMQGNVGEGLGMQEKYLQQSLAAGQQGYESGLQDVNRSESAGSEAIANSSAAALRMARGQAAQRGVTGGSGGTNLTMSAARDTNRQLGDFQMSIARQRSGLKIAQGQAKASGLGQLANFEAYKAGAKNNVLQPYFNWLGNIQYNHQSPALGGLGQLAGVGLGGGFGGGGGGSPPSGGLAQPTNLFGFPG